MSLLWASGVALAAEPHARRQAELMNLLVQDCGSCHGLKLTGGLGPPLTQEALAGKSAVMLREVILHGRPGTPMPGWSPLLSREDVDWIVSYLLRCTGTYECRERHDSMEGGGRIAPGAAIEDVESDLAAEVSYAAR